MAIRRKWEIQWTCNNPWFSFGFHIDHQDPSLTIHLPFRIFVIGNCKQPGFKKDSNASKNSLTQDKPEGNVPVLETKEDANED